MKKFLVPIILAIITIILIYIVGAFISDNLNYHVWSYNLRKAVGISSALIIIIAFIKCLLIVENSEPQIFS